MRRRGVLAATAALLPTSGCLRTALNGDEHVDATGHLEIVVDGEPLDLTQERFQAEHAEGDVSAFHLHEGTEEWFMEGAERVTVAEALDLLPACGYERDGWRALTIDGERYDERDEAVETATYVNDALVDPEHYRLADGDELRIAVRTDAARQRDPVSGQVDAAGEIDVLVDGEPVDLAQERFQAEHADDESLAFHFHEGSDQWYMEGEERVTFGGGLDRIPHWSYDREGGSHRLAVGDQTYDERDAGTELAFSLHGALVDPTATTLADGDELLVEVATAE